MMSCSVLVLLCLLCACLFASSVADRSESQRLGLASQLADNLKQLYPSAAAADFELQANSPTAMPSMTPAQDLTCRLISNTGNQSSETVCTNCVDAGCKWCTSGDYCFGNLNNNDDCSSYEYGSSIVCSTDLGKLIALLILIIFLSVCLPCICIGLLVAVFCFGVNVCFCVGRANTMQPSSTYNQPNQVTYGTPVTVSNPVVYASSTPIPGNANSGNPVVVVVPATNYTPQPTNNNEIAKGVIIGMDSPVNNVEMR